VSHNGVCGLEGQRILIFIINSSTSLPTGYKPDLLQTRLVGGLVTGGMNSCTLRYKLKAWPSGVT